MTDSAAARITYLGHSTVTIEAAGTCLVTDPLLRGHLLGFLRRRPPRVTLGAAERPDAILISHLHWDHLDVGSLRLLPAGTTIIAPSGSGRFLLRRGFPNVVELSEGESFRIGGVEVEAVRAEHGYGGRPGAGK